MHRLIRVAAIGGIALVAALWAMIWLVRVDPGMFSGTPLQPVIAFLVGDHGVGSPGGLQVGGPFSLTDGSGKSVSDESFRGRWMLIYFGYTYCPDVCPTELQTMATAMAKLGNQADRIVPIFITVDPERDTPAAIGEYVKLFDPRLVGLTGTPSQIADVTRRYRVYYVKVVSKTDSAYLMDHSSLVYLIDPQGKFAALYNPQTNADDMAAGLREWLSQRG